MNMAEDIHLPPLLQETSRDCEIDCEREIGAKRENGTNSCASKNDSFSDRRKSLNGESGSTGQPDCLTQHNDVNSHENSMMNVSSQHHHTLVAKDSDGGWGWVIVMGVFVVRLLLGGVIVSLSLLYLEFVDMFHASRAVAGWIGSLHIFMNHFFGIINGIAITRYGSRTVCIAGSVIGTIGFALASRATSIVHLYLALGILAGSGGGMMLISSMVLLQQYFNRRRALAASISGIGYSVGGLIFGPVTFALLQAYGVRGTLLILAGIYFQTSVFCCLFRPAPGNCRGVANGKTESGDSARVTQEMMARVRTDEAYASSKQQENSKHTTEQSGTENDRRSGSYAARLRTCLHELFADLLDFSLLRRIPFQLFLFSTFCLFMAFTSFVQHTPSRSEHFGIELWLISLLPLLVCSISGVSRLVFGFIANMSCTNLILQYAIAMTLSGLVQTMMWLATTFETIALYCVLLGTINGGCFSTLPTVLVDLNGIENIVKSMAFWTLAVGFGGLLGTPFSGFLFDVTGNYDIPFAVVGCIQTVGGLCAFCVYMMQRCKSADKQPS